MWSMLLLLSLQSCPTLCDPIDVSPQGSPVPGILQARTLEWVAISFSNAGKWKVRVKSLSRVQLLATPWTAAHQAPSSMGFSRQEYWSGLPLPSPSTDLDSHKYTLCLYLFAYSAHLIYVESFKKIIRAIAKSGQHGRVRRHWTHLLPCGYQNYNHLYSNYWWELPKG